MVNLKTFSAYYLKVALICCVNLTSQLARAVCDPAVLVKIAESNKPHIRLREVISMMGNDDLYKSINELMKDGRFIGTETPDILVLGPQFHYDEWLPFLLARPKTRIFIHDPDPIVQDKRFFVFLAQRILNGAKEQEQAPLSPWGASHFKKVLGKNELKQSDIIEFLKSKVIITNETELAHKRFDLVISRMPKDYLVNLDFAKDGGLFWIIEGDTLYQNTNQVNERFGASSIYELGSSHLSKLNSGQSDYTFLEREKTFKAYLVQSLQK